MCLLLFFLFQTKTSNWRYIQSNIILPVFLQFDSNVYRAVRHNVCKAKMFFTKTFCSVFFLIFTTIFSFSQNESATEVQIITNMFLCSIVLTEVLVYCFFGNELTYHVNPWFLSALRPKFIQLLIFRLARSHLLSTNVGGTNIQ